MACGIYRWTRKADGKAYVGQSTNVGRRFGGHLDEYERGASLPLYRDMMDDGPEGFTFELLERCASADLDEREEWWIAKHVNEGTALYNLLLVTREPNPKYAKDRGNRFVLPEEERKAAQDADDAVDAAKAALRALKSFLKSASR